MPYNQNDSINVIIEDQLISYEFSVQKSSFGDKPESAENVDHLLKKQRKSSFHEEVINMTERKFINVNGNECKRHYMSRNICMKSGPTSSNSLTKTVQILLNFVTN